MDDIRVRYKTTMVRIGAALLLWFSMFLGMSLVVGIVEQIIFSVASPITAEVVSSILFAVAYMAAFSLAALIFHKINKQEYDQPVRFEVKLPKNSFVYIFAGVGCAFAFSVLNSLIMSFLQVEPAELFIYPHEFSPDRSIILQFISIALVPAFCEELLFRGVVLSNLMPYGKAGAIVISSVLFGLMHGNMYQFVYTTVAGIIMGTIYVLTESIWCSILMHMVNNTFAIFQSAIYDRFSDDYSWIIWLVIDCLVVFFGVVLSFALVKKIKGRDSKKIDGIFGKTAPDEETKRDTVGIEDITFSSELKVGDMARGFLVPTVLCFVILCWLEALLVLNVV